MEQRSPSLFLQVLSNSCEEPANLIPAVRHKENGIPTQFYEFQRILHDNHRALLKVDELLNLSLIHLPEEEPL